jgi:hypothetical protein
MLGDKKAEVAQVLWALEAIALLERFVAAAAADGTSLANVAGAGTLVLAATTTTTAAAAAAAAKGNVGDVVTLVGVIAGGRDVAPVTSRAEVVILLQQLLAPGAMVIPVTQLAVAQLAVEAVRCERVDLLFVFENVSVDQQQ